MDSVRFSIIENDLQWKQHNFINIDDDINANSTDNKSISSESSVGVVLPGNNPHGLNKDFNINDQEIYQGHVSNEILNEIQNSEQILNIINGGDLSVITIGSEEVNSALLISILIGHNEYVLKLITHFYADINISDYNGRTALHLACLFGNIEATRILLANGADVNQWDKYKQNTPLHCAVYANCIECIELLLKYGAQVNAGIEKRSALHVAIEKNYTDCVEILLKSGANPNTPQVYTETPLHTAAGLGHKECMLLLLEHGADVRSQFGKRRLTALHLAAEDDYATCVKLLLQYGAKVDCRNVDGQTPLHMACLSQATETVEILLKSNADVNAIYKDGRTALHAAIVKESKGYECARLLLNAGIDVNKPDNYGYTPLHIAALNEFASCAYMLIEYGADITARTHGGISALAFIVRRTPEVIPKFLEKFDSSIKVNEHEIGDVDCEIKLDFKLLVPTTERGETELLLAFIEVGQKRILKHPLCETFIFLKWRRIRKFFLFSLFYHTIYVLMFTLYILGVYDKNCPKSEITKDDDEEKIIHCQTGAYVAPVGYIVVFLNLLLIAKEFFQMGHSFAAYIKYWENWVQWIIMIGVFSCATPSALMAGDLRTVPKWQHHVAAIVIFLVWLELMMLVGRFPVFGLYVQMFTKVAVNFSKFLLAYCCLLIAFGLSFGVLFANYPAFQYVPWSMIKTITMMSGELEFEDIFYGPTPIEYPVTAHGMFVVFVLLVTVILTNLLVGLAVSDIQGLQASAGLDRLSRQAELVARLESLFFSRILRKAPPGIILMCQRSALLRTSRYHLQFCIKPNDPRDTRLPKDLILSIYKLVAERRDRNQSIKRKRREQNLSLFTTSFNRSIINPISPSSTTSSPNYINKNNINNNNNITNNNNHNNNISNSTTNIIDGVRIRNQSTHSAYNGPRTYSDNIQQPIKSFTEMKFINRPIKNTKSNDLMDNNQRISEIDRNIEKLKIQLTESQKIYMKKLEDILRELGVIKMRLEENL